MKKNSRFLLALLLLCSGTTAMAQGNVLSLDSCRAMAIRNNKELQMSQLKIDAAHWNKKAAFTKYLPHVDAAGSYVRTSREVSLLNDDQKGMLENAGTAVGQTMQGLTQTMGQMYGQMSGQLDPNMAAMLGQLLQKVSTTAGQLPAAVDAACQSVLDAFRTDTRNMTVMTAMFTQPVYMGGKIRAYNKITKYAEELAESKHDLEKQNVIVAVDQTYWNIVQLNSKKKLAQSYIELIQKLDSDVDKLIQEGFATKADGLSVKVKLNEAEVTMIQINNGLSLLKMLLAQECGLEDYDFTLADENSDSFEMTPTTAGNAQEALALRPEMHQLQLASDIYREKVKLARAEFMPTVALTGGYMLSNPSVFNGFQNKFGGMWNIGIGAKIPVLTWGERIYKVRAAKSEAKIQQLHMTEVSEKIELQVKQSQQKLMEAQERMLVAEKSKASADENLRMAEYGLKEGVIPMSNVLAAQTAWLSAHSTYVGAQIDMKLADLYLRKAMGQIY